MESLFVRLYRFLKDRPVVLWSVFAGAVLVVAAVASRITIEEDITRFFPDDERVEKLNYVFRHARFAERIVVMVSMEDSTANPAPDSLTLVAAELVTAISSDLTEYAGEITAQVDDEKIMALFEAIHQYLPVYLEEKNYRYLDSLVRDPAAVEGVLAANYRQLISPSGVVTKKVIVRDPLGFSFLVLEKLRRLQYDENFELYDGYIMTRDQRNLIFFMQPSHAAGKTGVNKEMVRQLDDLIERQGRHHPGVKVSYFGAPVVAAGNASQLRRDTILTLSIMVVLLIIFLVGFFRKKRVPFLIFIPVLFGAMFSLASIFLVKGSASVLALAAGSIILGIAINYSLHFLSHLKHTHNTEEVIRALVKPMTLGSATTVLAFFCLQFANAAVLRDVGLFAGFSLIGAVLCTLIFLPHLVRADIFQTNHRLNPVEKLLQWDLRAGKVPIIVILLITPVLLYLAPRVSFNSDLSRLNFMKPELRAAQVQLERINHASLNAVYVVSEGKDIETALRRSERTTPLLEELKSSGNIDKFSSVSTFLISDSLQRVRIARWNTFWTPARKERLSTAVKEKGAALRFSPIVFHNFDSLLSRSYRLVDTTTAGVFRNALFRDYIIEQPGRATVISLVNVPLPAKEELYTKLKQRPANAFDRQMITNLFVEYIHADFTFIVTVTSLLVFLALWISYGRIELTLITFIPMFLTWIWILGIMALVGIEFNIINVMISTFIFGLGDDFSIFTMDGLQDEYARGRKTLPSIRTSILLSALTTISGLGVLIFAQHPALRSIAAISIIGIVCVFVMSQTVEPFLFRLLITARTEKGFAPATAKGLAWTLFTFGFFVVGSILLTVVGLLFKLIPFGKKGIRKFYHMLISGFVYTLISAGLNVSKKIQNRTAATFQTPSVIISNHTSFMDILLTIMLHPKVILLTNKWVWNSPVFGGVVRLADYYPVTEGAEESTIRLQKRVEDGYSIVVFPEGSRSPDKKIRRFHKGAFYIAEVLNVPITPLIIHGAGDVIPKGEMYLHDGHITLAFLPRIAPDDVSFGTSWSERAKKISQYFKEVYARVAHERETPDYFRYTLLSNYIYKGPVLEWYARIKTKLEKNYAPFDALIPREASVLDLGCGYGFLCYMLHFVSPMRKITGVDYDEDKIGVAKHCYRASKEVQFIHADATEFSVSGYDVIVLADVLHYLQPAAQEQLLAKCLRSVNEGGMIIVREGNADLTDKHWGTRLTEFFSVTLLGFNKSTTGLSFLSGEFIRQVAGQHGFAVEVAADSKLTSNVIFVIRKLNRTS